MSAREVARRVLDRVDKGGAWATLTLDGELARSGLDERDRRLASELVYGVLRHRSRIDRALAAHADLKKTPPKVRTALRVAAYQLLFLDRVPAYAAVDDAVAAARDIAGAKVGGFTNAVLRKIATAPVGAREPAFPVVTDTTPLEVRLQRLELEHSLPRWILDELLGALKVKGETDPAAVARRDARLAELAAAFGEQPPVIARANRLKTTRDALASELASREITATPVMLAGSAEPDTGHAARGSAEPDIGHAGRGSAEPDIGHAGRGSAEPNAARGSAESDPGHAARGSAEPDIGHAGGGTAEPNEARGSAEPDTGHAARGTAEPNAARGSAEPDIGHAGRGTAEPNAARGPAEPDTGHAARGSAEPNAARGSAEPDTGHAARGSAEPDTGHAARGSAEPNAARGSAEPDTGHAARGSAEPNAARGSAEPDTGHAARGSAEPDTGHAARGSAEPDTGHAARGSAEPDTGHAARGSAEPNDATGAVTRSLPCALRLEGLGDPSVDPGFAAGRWTVQDAGAQLVGELAAPRAGMRILDACAGVGGKSTHLAELADDAAMIDAADQSATKLGLLRETAQRLGLASIATHACDLLDPAAPLRDDYDLIVLDAPCSGLGVLRRHPDAKWRLTRDTVPRLADLQRQLLDAVVKRLAPGGTLIYAVCTFTRAEGPEQIAAFAERAGLRIVDEQRTWPPVADAFYIAKLVRA